MSSERCPNCGNEATYHHVYPVDSYLIATWELTPGLAKIFNDREGLICTYCGANKRAQGLALAILQSKFGYGQNNLIDWVEVANEHKLKVCELNSCHELHKTLEALKDLTYAEYGTKTQQDIENLTYANNTFNLVLHSETLEHVGNPTRAMNECRRVISDKGLVLFSVPIIWNRKTRNRAHISKGKIVKILPASYHGYKTDDYLVFQEYGNDIDAILGVKIAYCDAAFQNFIFESGKAPARINKLQKMRLKNSERKETRKYLDK